MIYLTQRRQIILEALDKGFEGMFVDPFGTDHIIARINPLYKTAFLMMTEYRYFQDEGWVQC